MNDIWLKDLRALVDKSEKAKDYPREFINSIEYVHSVFGYILSLIEIKKTDGDPDSFN